jgi:RNA polymerase sigma-70 factor (ECF subfamily)
LCGVVAAALRTTRGPVVTESERSILPSFEAVTLPLLPDLLRFARSLTRDLTSAEDLVQDVYLAALRNWHQYDPALNCRHWLFAICRNRFHRISSRAQRQVATDDAELESLAATSPAAVTAADFAALVERSDVKRAIQHAMVTLPDPFREVALLVDWHDLTYEAAAGILDVPVGTVRSRLFRARRILQRRLAEHARDAGLFAPLPAVRMETSHP